MPACDNVSGIVVLFLIISYFYEPSSFNFLTISCVPELSINFRFYQERLEKENRLCVSLNPARKQRNLSFK